MRVFPLLFLPLALSASAQTIAFNEEWPEVAVTWLASEMIENSCIGPEGWMREDFDDAAWETITMPDLGPLPAPGSRFYRGYFEVPTNASVYFDWFSDDGSLVYLNGERLGAWGGDCLDGGCVGPQSVCNNHGDNGGHLDLTDKVRPGLNFLAVRVGNAAVCCGSGFHPLLTTDGLTQHAIDAITEPGLAPDQPRVVPSLAVEVTEPSTDPEGQQVFYTYRWISSGGDAVTHGPTLRTSDRLTEHHLIDPGEVWAVTITPTDGHTHGRSQVVTFTVPHQGGLMDTNNDGEVDAADVQALVGHLTGRGITSPHPSGL